MNQRQLSLVTTDLSINKIKNCSDFLNALTFPQGSVLLHPVLLHDVFSGLQFNAQILASRRGKAPKCKSIGRNEMESYDIELQFYQFISLLFSSVYRVCLPFSISVRSVYKHIWCRLFPCNLRFYTEFSAFLYFILFDVLKNNRNRIIVF